MVLSWTVTKMVSELCSEGRFYLLSGLCCITSPPGYETHLYEVSLLSLLIIDLLICNGMRMPQKEGDAEYGGTKTNDAVGNDTACLTICFYDAGICCNIKSVS